MVKEKVKSVKIDILILAALFTVLLVYCKGKPERNFLSVISLNEIREIEGTIVTSPVKTSTEKSYAASLKLSSVTGSENVISQAKGEIKILLPKETVEAYYPGKLYTSSFKKNHSEIPVIDTGLKLKLRGKFSSGFYIVESIESWSWNDSCFSFLMELRSLSRLKFRRLMYFWKSAGGLFLALLSGIKEYTDKNLTDNFRNAGLSHILALSGMHLSLFQGIVKKGLSKTKKIISAVIQFIAILVFLWFAGITPSLFRAFLCSTLILFSGILNIKNESILRILSISFLVHALIFPSHLFEISFMLSYSALLGIILFGKLCEKLSSKKIPSVLAPSIGTSAAAQSFTGTITARLFGTLTPGGIISTVFVSPLITVFIYSGLLMIILSLICPYFDSCGALFMKIQYNLIDLLVGFFSRIPFIKLTD